MRLFLCALVALALTAAACSGEEPPLSTAAEPVATTDATPAPTATSTATPAPTAADTATEEPTEQPTEEPTEKPRAPLTGVAVADPALLERPVLAVKVDNAPAARPQVGLQEADVVFTELVEGGVTRFLALYQSMDPGTVGPVRSGREVDALLLPSFTPLVAMSGAHDTVHADFAAAGLRAVEERQTAGWSRFANRPRPHNLFLNGPLLWEAATDRPPIPATWRFSAEPPAGGTPAAAASVSFPRASSTWTFAEGSWLRDQDGGPHLVLGADVGEPRQVSATNVLVVRVSVRPGDRTDASGTPTVDIAAIGEGEATLLRDGQAFTGRWRKPSPDEPYEWLDADGAPLPLKPGNTWIELLPTDGGFQITP